MSRGYLFIALGKEYVDEVSNLVRTLRKVGDTYPASILCKKEDVDYINQLGLYHYSIPYEFDNYLALNDKTNFERYGGTPKIMMSEYTPYDETIYTDADILVQSNPAELWDYMKSMNEPYITTGGKSDINNQLSVVIGKKINKLPNELNLTHSGLVYFDKTNYKFNEFIKLLKFYWENYYEENLAVSEFRGGKADEHAIFAAVNTMNIKVLDPTKVPSITHNYHYDIELPSKIVTGGSRYNVLTILESAPPFIHMFKDGRGEHYKILYERLINI